MDTAANELSRIKGNYNKVRYLNLTLISRKTRIRSGYRSGWVTKPERLLKQYAAPLFMQYIDVIAGVVREGQEEGAFRPDLNPRVVARSLFGAIDAILLTWALGEGDPQALRKAAGHCASLFLEGLRKR